MSKTEETRLLETLDWVNTQIQFVLDESMNNHTLEGRAEKLETLLEIKSSINEDLTILRGNKDGNSGNRI